MKAKYVFPSLFERKKQSHSILQKNKTYALRSNRITDSQQKHFERGMQEYGISNDVLGLSASSEHTNLQFKIKNKITKNFQSVILDIGFGYGTSLLDLASQRNESLFVGIEVYKAGIGAMFYDMYNTYNNTSKKNVDNILVYHDDALKVLFYEVEDESIEAFHVFFPDPWHKRKHNKRRLLTCKMLLLMYQLLIPRKGYMYFLSDNKEYRNEVQHNIETINAEYRNKHIYWQKKYTVPISLRQKTKFELRGIQQKKNIHSLVVQRSA